MKVFACHIMMLMVATSMFAPLVSAVCTDGSTKVFLLFPVYVDADAANKLYTITFKATATDVPADVTTASLRSSCDTKKVVYPVATADDMLKEYEVNPTVIDLDLTKEGVIMNCLWTDYDYTVDTLIEAICTSDGEALKVGYKMVPYCKDGNDVNTIEVGSSLPDAATAGTAVSYKLAMLGSTVDAASSAYKLEFVFTSSSNDITIKYDSAVTSKCDKSICFTGKKDLGLPPTGLTNLKYTKGSDAAVTCTTISPDFALDTPLAVTCSSPTLTFNFQIVTSCGQEALYADPADCPAGPTMSYKLDVLGGTVKTAGASYSFAFAVTAGSAATLDSGEKTSTSDSKICYNVLKDISALPTALTGVTYLEGEGDAVTLETVPPLALDTPLTASSVSGDVSIDFQFVSYCDGSVITAPTPCKDSTSFASGLQASIATLLAIIAVLAILL